ncbi:type IV secretion system protein [Georgenia satyanarayanai]|uniref:type IV secretion system protein n=1 Tax=Georgenia satyanarayanai TaxID=860221 RepID=UPI00203EEDF1|nr:type IV secretion system protein [Georgenia satyanarayanai]MCM3662523.1 type IV secretion system protein [Georgenia satyanarayanai]
MDEDDNPNLWDRATGAWDGLVEGVQSAGDAVSNAVAFGSDPLGFLFEKAQDAAYGLTDRLLPALFDATKPDLSADWFLEAYAVSYAAAVFLWVINLLWTIMRSAQGVYTSDDVAEVLTTRAALFFGMSTFGPAAGWLVLQFFAAVAESMAQWGINSSVDESIASLASMIEQTDAAGVVGGVLVALGLMVAMVVGLVLVVITLWITMVAVYLGGAVAPLAFAWLGNPTHHRIATRLLVLLLGVIAAKPLLFFVLGIAYRMASGSVTWLEGGSTDVQTFANLGAAMIALCVAGMTPFLLFKFAPVTPTGAGQAGPAVSKSSRDGNDREEEGSQTQRRARQNARRRQEAQGEPEESEGGSSSSSGSGSSGSGSGGAADGGQKTGPIQKALEAKQRDSAHGGSGGGKGKSGAGEPGGESAATTGTNPTTAGAAAAKGGGPAAAGAGSGGAGASTGSAAGAGGAAGGAGGAAARAGGAAGKVGGAVGAGVAVAYMAAKKSAEKGAQAGEVSAKEMDDQGGGSQ